MMKRLTVAMLFAIPAVAFSATYAVTVQSGVTTGAKLTVLGQTSCVYADVPIALGDILKYPDGSRQVCASGQKGPLLIDVASEKEAKH
ncbi:hypothetical protein L0Z02_29450 (plasmid) [Burkholderia multivorans]|uniref:Bacteriophage protein n=1 Tax=Burkholderia multivorans TaxID=87883 RepID=A0AAP2MRQ6_9BURK|nr:hypothetical protein [Burkholderia multivorans]MBU9360541.1 hypothetical protein [Burkholderia multivorans]MCO1459928.1 hypothetical protein [Burkholderia multivorans]MCO1459979.1 hypothetical protein [Burkholderia multivorans]UQO21339.1 hypothetical protein L0Z02_29450 [Burkholderia multivorans]